MMPDCIEIPWAKEIGDCSAHDCRSRFAPGLYIFVVDIPVTLIGVDVRKQSRNIVDQRAEVTLTPAQFSRLFGKLFAPPPKIGRSEIDPALQFFIELLKLLASHACFGDIDQGCPAMNTTRREWFGNAFHADDQLATAFRAHFQLAGLLRP